MDDDVRTLPLPSGADIPLLGFGTWELRGQQAYDATREALRVGYRHVDTATAYRNEAEIGRAVRESGLDRSEVFVTTKLPPDRADRPRDVLEQSLAALGVDQVDLWLIHWPAGGAADVDIWRELVGARDAGLARDIGVSNFEPADLQRVTEATGVTPAVNQVKWSPQIFDPDRLADSRSRGVLLEGYSPFRAGDLGDPALAEIAEAHGVTPAQVVLRWHVEHRVVVIPKSARPERIASNADIFGFSLTADEVARIDALAR
jgi:2,5-diketo-D-gluconate reductase A